MKKKQGMPLPLGASRIGDTVNFSFSVDPKSQCELVLFESGKKEEIQAFPMEANAISGMVRSIGVEGITSGNYEYLYRVDGTYVMDPYVKGIMGQHAWGKPDEKKLAKGKVLLETFDWGRDVPLQIPYSDVIGYSLHVRGFTKHASAKVKAPGTFRGVIEKIPYLLELGVNQIQCMPVYEFDECGRYINFWGYGDGFYFAPKCAYSSREDSTLELKEMIKACHDAGIEVVLELPFGEDCSQELMMQCLEYYTFEYHVDGFILNPLKISIEDARKNPILYHVKIMKKNEAFQTIMRRFLKGDEGTIGEVIWWLKHTSKEEGIFNYIAGQNGFTLNDVVSYDGKHNELNGENNQDGPDYNYSWNCGVEGPTRRKAVCELREKQIRNALFLLILSQGTPVILAGDECYNSQKGNNNAYCQDNTTGWTNWSGLVKKPELFEYVKMLIALRKQYPVFHPEEEYHGIDYSSCGIPDVSYHGEDAWSTPDSIASRQLGVYYAVDGWKIFIAYNMHWEAHEFALPTVERQLQWHKVISTGKPLQKEVLIKKEEKKITVDAREIVMLIAKEL